MFSSLNEVAILVAAILAVAVESIWYSPLLFGSVWKKSAGLTQYVEDISVPHMVRTTIVSVITYAFLFVCAVYVMHVMGETHTFLQSVGLLAVLLLLSLILDARREFRSWMYVIVHAGFIIVTLFGGLGVIMYWPW